MFKKLESHLKSLRAPLNQLLGKYSAARVMISAFLNTFFELSLSIWIQLWNNTCSICSLNAIKLYFLVFLLYFFLHLKELAFGLHQVLSIVNHVSYIFTLNKYAESCEQVITSQAQWRLNTESRTWMDNLPAVITSQLQYFENRQSDNLPSRLLQCFIMQAPILSWPIVKAGIHCRATKIRPRICSGLYVE